MIIQIGLIHAGALSSSASRCDRATGEPTRPALLWCDARASAEAEMVSATGDEALRVGNGPTSAEWMLPKALWIKRHEPEVWEKSSRICEAQDWLNFKLTGVWVANACNVATRWHGDGEAAAASAQWDDDDDDTQSSLQQTSNNNDDNKSDNSGEKRSWRPESLLRALGLSDDLGRDKWPSRCVAMGRSVGPLSPEAREHLGGLPATARVVQGGADAFVALVGSGLGATPGSLVVTGSSHLQLSCAPTAKTLPRSQLLKGGKASDAKKSIWGPYRGAPLAYTTMAEAGQSSTGSALRFVADTLLGKKWTMAELDALAARIPPGSDGVRAVETFQGSRTPVCDPDAKGALSGLALSHGAAHVWRAFLEAIALGTRDNLRNLQTYLLAKSPPASGSSTRSVRFCGGATRSDVFLQVHSDVAGVSIVADSRTAARAPVVGAALLAAAWTRCCTTLRTSDGCFGGDNRAQDAAIQKTTRAWGLLHDFDKEEKHSTKQRPSCVTVISPDPANARRYAELFPRSSPKDQEVVFDDDDDDSSLLQKQHPPEDSQRVRVSASLLAADFGHLAADAVAASRAGAWLHVDVCDASDVARGKLSSLGPASIRAVRDACGPDAIVDAHLAVSEPEKLLAAIADAGADVLTLQVEAFDNDEERLKSAVMTVKRDLKKLCGLALAPATPLSAVDGILKGDPHLVDLIDVLAVEPGEGGQTFQDTIALDKLRALRREYPTIKYRQVDGGVNVDTAKKAVEAGANVLAAGSFVFKPSSSKNILDDSTEEEEEEDKDHSQLRLQGGGHAARRSRDIARAILDLRHAAT